MTANHERYLLEYHEKKKDAARCFNNIHAPLTMHPLDLVSPPYLHITLGLVKRHHNLLEAAVHVIDRLISDLPDRFLTPIGQKMKDYGGNWKMRCELEDEANHLSTCAVMTDDVNEKQRFERQEEEVCRKMEDVQHERIRAKFHDPKRKREGLGMLCLSLDKVLNKHKITPQKFHSRSFVGNHCNKYLQPEVHQDITAFVITQTEKLTTCPLIRDKARLLKLNFDRLNMLLNNVHRNISHCKPLSQTDIQTIDTDIHNYMQFYRQLFINKTTPKHHILEKHCVPFLKRTGIALGLTSEQGIEASHQSVSRIDTRASGMQSQLEKNKFVLKASLLQNSLLCRYFQK